ncbi:MAG: hypothetical protein Q8O33_17095 [Pseudomonadota bacterium]|nr:hypothetical protein [Pseudomonadota bacterium]
MSDYRAAIGVQGKAQAAANAGRLGKACNAAMRGGGKWGPTL